MIVFVDWENVCGKEGSLDGVEYLTSDDILEIFYSERCPSMKNVDFEKLKMSTCKVNLTKLKTPRKNALDFYICCKIGIYLKEYNFKDINICILSEDTGFDSCLDFISCISERENVWKARRNCINDLILYFKEPDKEHLLDGLKVINDSTPFDSLLEEYNKVLEQKLEEESRINNIIFEYEKMKSLLDGRDLNEIIDVYNASINSNKDELFSPETYD